MAKKPPPNTIAVHKKANFSYFLEDTFEAGLALLGWEVKSLRAGRVQLNDAYVLVQHGECWLIGMHLSPLANTPDYLKPDPQRTRKLLLHRKQIQRLIGQIKQKGYALIPTRLYWKGPHIKLEIALAKGKKMHDKRATEKDRDWKREKQQLLKHQNR